MMFGPNIIGHISASNGPFYQADGPFYVDHFNSANFNVQAQGSGNYEIVRFDTSRASSLYGASSSVQPPAGTIQYLIKY